MPEQDDLSLRCDHAQKIARRAGELALEGRARVLNGGIANKGPQDFVTEVDRKVEEFIREQLASHFPQDAFLGEEDGGQWENSGTWVVDPIDGTTNYIRGLPSWGVSIAYLQDGVVRIGVIHDPVHRKTYAARLGQGATLNGRPLAIRPPEGDIASSLVILGTNAASPAEEHTQLISHLFAAGAEYRRTGSAAIGLAMVAEGVAEAYYEGRLNSWDALAGMLICQETGLKALNAGLAQHMRGPSPVLAGRQDVVALIRREPSVAAKPLVELGADA